MMPAARGAAADVPVWRMVHVFLRSVVACSGTRRVCNAWNCTQHASGGGTYDHLVPVGPRRVRRGHGGGAALAVPREVASL